MQRPLSLALLLFACTMASGANNVSAASSEPTQLAQAQAAPDPATSDPATPAADAQAPEEPVGNVATVTGKASVIRNDKTTPLKVKDDIYLNDVVQTAANSALGITFIDATTFNLKANTKITIDNYVYEDGGKSNAAIFDVARGTAAFVAAAVAKSGDMKITTPTATLGIRGTTGLVEVPEGAAANNPNNVAVKLYPDADGRVGQIEVNDRAGARLGFLTQGASGFTIRPGAGGARFAAVPLTIPQRWFCATRALCGSSTRRKISDGKWCSSSANSAAPIPISSIRTGRTGSFSPARTGRMVRRDKAGRDNCSPVSQIVLDSSNGPVTGPVNSKRRARRTARDSSSGAPRRDPARRRAPAAATPGLPNQPVCRHAQDSRRDPICRCSPACRRARADRSSHICRRNQARRRAGPDRTGSALPDCSGRRAFRAHLPCSGRVPCRNGAGRRTSHASRSDQAARRSQSRIRCSRFLCGCCRARTASASATTGSISRANEGGAAGSGSTTGMSAVASIVTAVSSSCASGGAG